MSEEAGLFGPLPKTVTLNGSGNGQVSIQAVGKKLQITNTTVSVAPVAPNTSPVNEALVYMYKGQVGKGYLVGTSMAGSTGDQNDTVYFLNDGEALYIVWNGGDAGALATATFSGWSSVPGRGFRAIH